jgi:dTDP-4-amino-4,6-dideoxygalactose transaminase
VGAPFGGSAERDRLVSALLEQGVQAGKLSYALHTLPHFAREAGAARALKHALSTSEDIAARGLCLPLFPGMSEDQARRVIAAVSAALA